MTCLSDLSRKITSSPYFDSMQRFAAPLDDFGINHFWYYQITDSGYYTYLGSHTAWSEYCFSESLLSHFPCIKHPSLLKNGISLMKADPSPLYQKVLDTAWDKFKINFNINLIAKTAEGVEAFGFATRYRDPHEEERLLNELPWLRLFIKLLREKYKGLFEILKENQVKLSAQIGSSFFEPSKELTLPQNRRQFLQKLGLVEILLLTPRELEVLAFIPHGFPASYIALKLHLSVRTVENYLVSIKGKLSCESKVELIQKAKELAILGFIE